MWWPPGEMFLKGPLLLRIAWVMPRAEAKAERNPMVLSSRRSCVGSEKCLAYSEPTSRLGEKRSKPERLTPGRVIGWSHTRLRWGAYFSVSYGIRSSQRSPPYPLRPERRSQHRLPDHRRGSRPVVPARLDLPGRARLGVAAAVPVPGTAGRLLPPDHLRSARDRTVRARGGGSVAGGR